MFPAAIDLAAALARCAGALAILLLLALLLDRRRLADRTLLGLTAAAPVLTYAAWRIGETLPAFDLTVEALWPRLYLGFELVAVAYSLASMLVLVRCSDAARREEADAAEAAMAESGAWPAVDVFICTYDEPLPVLEKAIVAALGLDYPGELRVWVLDDTRRDWLARYCATVGARHVTRPDNRAAKAGNLNNGLRASARAGGAPLILVLDADFAPQRHLLRRVVGLFRDPAVGVVQTPQFYFNPDPVQHNLHASASWVDDQRTFFDVFQSAKDAVGCAFCVGTSFVVRRDLVEEIGGFPEGCVSEDIHLTYALLRRGHVTRWLNERLSIGRSAEGLAEYATQRARWCLGTVQVALLRDGPFRGGGFALRHRLHYAHGLLNWLCKPFLALMLVAPAVHWLGGVPALHADHLSFLTYGGPALLAFWVYSTWISGGRSLPLFTEVAHAVACLPVSGALAAALVRPFGRPFKVTAKGSTRDGMVIHLGMALPFGLNVLLTLAGVVWSLTAPDGPAELPPEDLLNLIWASVAMVLSLACLLVCCERPRPRREERFPVLTEGWLRPAGAGQAVRCLIEDLSVGGAGIRCAALPAADGLELGLPGIGWVPATVIRTAGEDRFGLALAAAPGQHRRLVLLLFGNARENIARRGRLLGALRGFAARCLRPA